MDAQRGLIQGVPTYWAAAPGPLVGGLMFRVGFIDENLFQRGLSHLLEHLALAELDVDFAYNGQTELGVTSFFAKGTEPEVIGFLEHVAGALANIPWQRLEAEASVLNAEAAQRGSSLLGAAAWATYGPAHAGLLDSMELAHDRLDKAEIERWSHTYFNRDNCVLWFHGPKPAQVNLGALPSGQRMVSPEPERIIPARRYFRHQNLQSPGAFTKADRSWELGVGLTLLGRRINDRLRNDLGAAYGAHCESVNFSADSRFVLLSTQASADDASMVYEECAYEINKLAYDGCTDEELSWFYQQFVRATQDPASGAAAASGDATNELYGAQVYSDQETADRLKSLDKTAIGHAIAEMAESLFWLMPGEYDSGDRRLEYPPVIDYPSVQGQTFQLAKDSRVEGQKPHGLVVAADGFSFFNDCTDSDTAVFTMPGTDMVGGFRTRDNSYIFWSSQAKTFHIDPADWDNPEQVRTGLEALLPAELWVTEREFKAKERSRFNYAEAAA